MIDVQRIDESQAGPAPEPQNFTGRVACRTWPRKAAPTKLELLAVHFDAGAHTRPHTHPSEQVLSSSRGNGFVWFPGEERQRVAEGSIVVVPAGVVHMHGATEDEPICHIALRAADGPTDWAPADVPDDWRQLLRPGAMASLAGALAGRRQPRRAADPPPRRRHAHGAAARVPPAARARRTRRSRSRTRSRRSRSASASAASAAT